MTEIRIPADLLPQDGRFGSGPSLVRTQQLDDLMDRATTVIGTSHRQQPVKQLVHDIREGIADLYRVPDGYEVLLANGGASAFWDAAAFGLIEKRAQTAVFGEFSSKFAHSASAPWLEAPDVREAAAGSVARLEAAEGIDLYATAHNETSTGAMVSIERVQHDGALTMVDATSAAGGIAVDLSATDVYYFSPQKNFGSDGGLWLAVVSPAAIERIERIAASDRFIPEFLSLKHAIDNSRKDQTLNTPAVASLSLLESQVRWMNENGGLEFVDARTRQSSNFLYEWIAHNPWASAFVAEEQYRSQVVVTIDLDESVNGKAVTSVLREHGIVDIEPYRKLGRNQLRVGTFASVDPVDVSSLADCITYVVERLD
ncbi:phosphoserine transaminase [Gulosibacter molinativorax]|uniref:phosphoserine transaminase n=1 Tax=Gulosibacter molinativorax TaxID=256821 RepID=A0ABT7CA63_9MICO|nr:phosphoserine transaminase [Gulosibacter molinativorax]MDJ1372047.1 phosphoserine transaminase [Gulosibacter molinativorax]QUY63904.1 Phosphoserine transaminase [Gulosibacter molinativorax]